MTPEQIAAICPECHGSGRFDYQVAACCGNVLASGECCGMPVGEHRCDPCERCQGSGLAVRAILEKQDD